MMMTSSSRERGADDGDGAAMTTTATPTADGRMAGSSPTQTQAFVSPFSPLFSRLSSAGRGDAAAAAAGGTANALDSNHHDEDTDDDHVARRADRDPQRPSRTVSNNAKDRWFQQLSLNGARKVSIVVRVDAAPTTMRSTGETHQDDDNDVDVCLFPLVLSSSTTAKDSSLSSPVNQHQQRRSRHHAGPNISSQEIVVVNPDAFGSQLQLPASVTMERARLVSLLSRKVMAAAAALPSTTTNETPTKGTDDNPTEDWIRSYRFSSVVWSTAPTSSTSTSTPLAAAVPTVPPADSDCWARLCKAMAGDVTLVGSIARRTVISVGGTTTSSDIKTVGTGTSSTNRKSKAVAALSPMGSVSNTGHGEIPAKTTAVFGTIATESVAHVLANDHMDETALVAALQHDPTPILHRYGLLGLTCCYILQSMGALDASRDDARGESIGLTTSSPSSTGSDVDMASSSRRRRRKLRLTLSILEVADEDLLYDLLKLKPFARESAVMLKHSSRTSTGGGTAGAGAAPSGDDRGPSAAAATLVGLTDTPIDSLRTLGRCVRRAFTMAYHARRTKPRGTLIAMLKVWDTAASTTSPQRHTVVQFVDLAQVVPEDGGTFWRESQKPRNARLRQSITALGAALRQVLLKEAGNSTVGSFREHTITQVLRRDLGGGALDSRIVLLANLGPLRKHYSETMNTIRYVSSIVTRPGDPLLSPFEKQQQKHLLLASGGDANPNDNHTKTTSSPTSRSSDDADDSFLTSASLTDDAILQGALLRSVVADPRQRMAKLVRPSKQPREQDSVNVLVGSNEPYTPTHYMVTDPGDAAAEFAKHAEELAKRGEVAVSASRGSVRTSSSPRDAALAAAMGSRGNTDSQFVMGSATSPLRGRHIELGFGSGTGTHDSQGNEEDVEDYLYGEPSPLTTDTGGRSAVFDFQRPAATSFPMQHINQDVDSVDDLRSMESVHDAQPRPRPSATERGSSTNEGGVASAASMHKSADGPKRAFVGHDDTVRHLQESVRGLQSQLQQSHESAASELAQEREHAEDMRQQLELELEELQLASKRKDEDLKHLQRSVDALRDELEAQRTASTERIERLHRSMEADGNLVQEQLEAENAQLRFAIQGRDDSIADLQSLNDAQRLQLQRRLDEVLSDLKLEREKNQSERSSLRQASQDLERVQREKHDKEATILRLQDDLDEAKSELQRFLERTRHDSDERVRQLEETCLQYRQEVSEYRSELSRRDDELEHLKGALASARAARDLSDYEEIQRLLLELEEARAELERRDARILELEAAVEQVESGRQEVLAIADEAIATQAQLEKRIQDLEAALSAMSDGSVPREQYVASEEAYERVSHELHEARDDLLRSKADANEAKVRLAEVQFSLQSIEKERDHLAMRDAENQRELSRLRSALQGSKSAGQEVERLSEENRRLMDELHQAQSLRSKYELELEQELARREEVVERSQEEAALIRNELDLVLAEHSAMTELNEQQIQDLRSALEDSERELSKLAAEANRSSDAASKELEASKRLMSAELDQLKQSHDRHLSDAEELLKRLQSVEQEKDAALAKAASLKRALVTFQDRTRTQVETFVHHRSETKALLERTLEENDALALQNRQLQAALEDLQSNPAGPIGRELDDALAQLSASRSENAQLRSDLHRFAETIEALRRQLERSGPAASARRPTDRHRGGDAIGDDGRAAANLLRTLNDLVESRRLDDVLRPHRHTSEDRQQQPRRSIGVPTTTAAAAAPRTHEFGTGSEADGLVANLALAAKATVDQRSAELSNLQSQLLSVDRRPAPTTTATSTRTDKLSDLNRRVRVLEGHRAVVDGLLSSVQQQQKQTPRPRRGTDDDDALGSDTEHEDDDTDQLVEGLTRRVRALERRLDRGWAG